MHTSALIKAILKIYFDQSEPLPIKNKDLKRIQLKKIYTQIQIHDIMSGTPLSETNKTLFNSKDEMKARIMVAFTT